MRRCPNNIVSLTRSVYWHVTEVYLHSVCQKYSSRLTVCIVTTKPNGPILITIIIGAPVQRMEMYRGFRPNGRHLATVPALTSIAVFTASVDWQGISKSFAMLIFSTFGLVSVMMRSRLYFCVRPAMVSLEIYKKRKWIWEAQLGSI